MKANSTSPEGARLYRQSKAQIQAYLEVCNQCRTYLAWAAFHIHRVTLKVVTPFNPLQAWGRKLVALLQTLESGRLVSFCGLVVLVCHISTNTANIQASFSLLNKNLLFFTNWREHLQSQFVNMNQARLALQVLCLAIVATLATFMYRTIIKHKHYFYEQQPHSQKEASTEGVTGPMPKRLTLLQLLELTHIDDLDAMVCNCVTQSCRHESCC